MRKKRVLHIVAGHVICHRGRVEAERRGGQVPRRASGCSHALLSCSVVGESVKAFDAKPNHEPSHVLQARGLGSDDDDATLPAGITGGTGTLGFEAGGALWKHGLAGLMVFDVKPSHAQEGIESLQKAFTAATISFTQVGITDDAAVARAVDETAQILASVDILCLTDDRTGVRRRGNMMFVASYSGHRVNSPQPQIAYNVSEAALLMLEGCSTVEWARYPGELDSAWADGDNFE
ncbi:unnamed protein product [Diplocarpon coronariae]